MMRVLRFVTIPRAIIALSAVVQGMYWLGIEAGFRPALAIAFLLICPGVAVVRHIRPGDVWEQLTLGMALSIALATAIGTVFVYVLGELHQGVVLVALTAIAVGGAALELRRGAGGVRGAAA